jgi:hypothetical protein
MNKKVPYGLSNFESIIKGNYLYVDKTQFIEKIETSGTHYISFFRPRRFGKSLSVSMLEYYYDFAFSKKFNELFENLYIGKNQTSLKNNYLVLRFDFSGIETNDAISTRIGFIANIIAGINNFNFKYNILSNKEIDSLKKITYPGNLLKEFFGYAQKRLDKKFYILVDEYDHFANELLAYDMEKFKELLMERGFVRKFYEVIKSATMNIVDRVFITGVTPITLDSLTSGFNIDSDLTYDLWFHDMMGFTEEEVKFSINESSADCNPPVLELLKSLKEYYNGYKFNEDAGHFVFNPEMVLYFLNHFTRYNNFPRNILDTNIASDYSKLKNIFKIGDPNKNFEILKEIAKEKKIKGKLIQSYDLVTKRFTEDDFISLLYYMGMLTIDRLIGAMIEFVIPNYVIKKLYYEYFLDEIFQKIKIN